MNKQNLINMRADDISRTLVNLTRDIRRRLLYMEHIKVSYNEHRDCEGYHTTQNIRLSDNLLQRFNIFLADCRKPLERKRLITNAEMDLLAYGMNIENLNKCLHITQLRLLYQFLTQNHIDCRRVKTDRNTMLIIG